MCEALPPTLKKKTKIERALNDILTWHLWTKLIANQKILFGGIQLCKATRLLVFLE